jgi:hypothetical protein
MHRSSEFHRARQALCRSVRLPRRTDPAGLPFLRSKTNSETCVTIRIGRRAPSIVGRRPRQRYDLRRKYRECRKSLAMMALHALGFRRAAPRNARCRFCRCSGDSVRPPPVPEATDASMACQDFPRSAANAIPCAVQLGGSHCLLCMRCRAGRKAFRALWKLRRILLRPLATLAIASIVQVHERGHLRSIESPWRQQCPKPLFRACSVDAASAA